MDNLKITGKVFFKKYARFESSFGRFFNRLLSYNTNLHLKFLNKYGIIKDEWAVDNLTMNASFAVLSGLAGNTGSQTAYTYLALGTSSTAVAATQTTLGAEITDTGLQRASATVSRVTTTQTNDTLQLAKTFTATGSKTVEEVGYFNAASVGVMGGRALTTSKALVNGETLATIYQIKFA